MKIAAALLSLLTTAVLGADEAKQEASPGAEMNAAERAFADKLIGATLTGRFTIDGQADEPKAERYEIANVTKATAENWVIVARVKYGSNDVKVPVPVKVLWAGDTPMISLTDLAIPGLGTFSSRVLFYGDRYAGTWQHGDKGGHLFGTVAKEEKPATEPKE